MIVFEHVYSYTTLLIAITMVLAGSLKNSKWVKTAGYAGLAIAPLALYMEGAIDGVSLIFSTLAVIVGYSSSMYCEIYEVEKYGTRDLHILIDLFAISVYATFASPNVMSFIIAWFIAEIAGFFTIVYEIKPENFKAGLRYLVVSMIPADLAILAMLAYLSIDIGFLNALSIPLYKLVMEVHKIPLHLSLIIITGFSAKAAIVPLHFWLPDAHSLAPAPASSILSGIMVKMGLYGILRILPLIEETYSTIVFLILGSLSAIYGGLLAIAQIDIKRILAYSTIENTGLMLIVLMRYKLISDPIPYYGFYTLLAAHALYKSALFMNSGTVEVLTHTRDITKLGFLSKVAPLSATSALLAVFSLIGVPPTIGFIAKLLLIESTVSLLVTSIITGLLLTIVVIIASALTIIYSIKYLTIYWGLWSVRKGLKINPSETRLVKWELIPSALGISVSLLVPVITGWGASIQIMLSLIFALTMFVLITTYMYSRMKRITHDSAWLGGEYP